jgi:hypothetical protein
MINERRDHYMLPERWRRPFTPKPTLSDPLIPKMMGVAKACLYKNYGAISKSV